MGCTKSQLQFPFQFHKRILEIAPFLHFSMLRANRKSQFQLGIEFYLFVSHGGMNDRGSTCKFRNARIQSLYLYSIKIVPFWLRNISFLIQNTRSLFYGGHYSSLHRLMSLHGKMDVKIFLMFIIAENTRSANIS